MFSVLLEHNFKRTHLVKNLVFQSATGGKDIAIKRKKIPGISDKPFKVVTIF